MLVSILILSNSLIYYPSTSCWDEPIRGLRYDDTFSHWFRTFFETQDELELVVFDDENFEGRPCKDSTVPNVARDGDMAAYHDMSPVHLCSTKSVSDLNSRLNKKNSNLQFPTKHHCRRYG